MGRSLTRMVVAAPMRRRRVSAWGFSGKPQDRDWVGSEAEIFF